MASRHGGGGIKPAADAFPAARAGAGAGAYSDCDDDLGSSKLRGL